MKKYLNNQDGSIIVLIAFGMTVFIAFMALVLDFGSLYLEKNRLQKIVDASALAGAQELPTNYSKAREEINKTIQFHAEDPNQFQIQTNQTYTMVEVIGSKVGKLYFASVLGIEDPIIQAKARVELQPLTASIGAIPLGIQPSTDLHYGQLQTLKVSDSASGNFGAIALTGPGAKDFETDLRSGYEFTLHVNNILDTQTGQLAGPTKRAIEHRLSLCTNATYTNYPPNCSRIVLVPVFEPVQTDQTQIKQVRVLGFATFFIEAVSSTSTGAEVTGRFIHYARSGVSSPTQANYGTYSFKLTQ